MHPHNKRLQAQAAKRRAKIKDMADAGMTYKEIGAKLGCTRQRIHQILKWEDGYKERIKG